MSTGEERAANGAVQTTASGAVEWHAPVLVRTDESTTIPLLLRQRVQRSARRALVEVKREIGGVWTPISAADFYEQVQDAAAGLIGLGLAFGDAVAIMSRTRYEWTLLDYACWFAGLVPVPIYETSSIEQIAHILADADAKVVVTETITMAELVRSAAQDRERDLLHVLSLDSGAIRTIVDAGAATTRSDVEARTRRLRASSTATIVYTSGTTGTPKGVVITQGGIATLAVNANAWMPEIAMGKDSRLLLFLPLAHILARFLEVFQLSGEGVLGHTSDTKNLVSDLSSFRPTYLLTVPRVLEKVYNTADAQQAGARNQVFRWAAHVAVGYSIASATAEGPSRSLSAQHAAADVLVYQKIRKLLGGNADYIISGGAPLSPRLAHFYAGAGVQVLEGYGLTETIGPASVNTPRLSKIGTVGQPLAPAAIKISEQGEVLVKGPTLFAGYHNDPAATAGAFTPDGWFRTGDLGQLDRDGYLRLTGRAKELIVTAGGKNVSPAALEDDLRGHPLISQIVVVGDQRPFIAALITLDAEMLPLWLSNHGLPAMSVREAATNIEVRASLERAVERANRHVSRAESIRKFTVLTTDLTEANGMLTPSLKVKRNAVLSYYADVIDGIYE
ncbi:AMP-dependent synthetase/ligase [Schaalia naturae]|uniref:Acyl-CoA synthetase n=1 Tax=Schaalia naturae TaxID=635203 RepID=A0ABW2SJP1_9ACTO